MGNFTRIAVAATALAISVSAASAADIIEEPVYEPLPVVGGWYLRGDIGMSNQELHGGLYNALYDDTENLQFLDSGTFGSAPTFRAGIGYEFNDYLRFDVTGQYRGKSSFAALDRYESIDDGNPNTWDGSNQYSAYKREWLIMANAYFDFGTFNGVTPYVGAGAGTAQVSISNFRDINTSNNGVAYAGNDSQWNFAWALYAGLGFDVTDRVTLDLGYSYVNLGDGKSGDIVTFDGTNSINNPMKFNDLISHDFTFGLRYKFY